MPREQEQISSWECSVFDVLTAKERETTNARTWIRIAIFNFCTLAFLSFDKILYSYDINNLRDFLTPTFCYEFKPCSPFYSFGLAPLFRVFFSHHSLLIENLALRQQLAVLKRRHRRPILAASDKAVLGGPSEVLANMEEGFDRRKARNGCALAPRRLPALLATHLPRAQVGRQETCD
jgi:hypothetical protein